MSEDILHRIRTTKHNINIKFSAEIYNEQITNSDAQREQQCDRNSLAVLLLITSNSLLLSNEIYTLKRIQRNAIHKASGFYYLNAPGGT
ncbi:unnamed protein product, partial [Ceratitis capitata]